MFLNFTHPSTNPKEPTQKNKKVTEHKNLWKDRLFCQGKETFWIKQTHISDQKQNSMGKHTV
jgi:hypothetical protein